jgi:hypothetical protein
MKKRFRLSLWCALFSLVFASLASAGTILGPPPVMQAKTVYVLNNIVPGVCVIQSSSCEFYPNVVPQSDFPSCVHDRELARGMVRSGTGQNCYYAPYSLESAFPNTSPLPDTLCNANFWTLCYGVKP